MFDFVVIGGGPGGYRVAELLSKNGLSVAVIEESNLGGTCLNEGCIPFKSYLHTTRIKADINKLMKHKCVSEAEISINQAQIFGNKELIVKGLRQGVENMLSSMGIKIFKGHASIKTATEGRYVFSAGDELIEAKKVVIATGSEDSLELEKLQEGTECTLLNSRKMLELKELPKSVDIVGGGVIGLESADFLVESGCKVRVIEATHGIGGHIDGEISDAIKKIMQKKGVEFLTDTSLLNFEHNEVIYQQAQKRISGKPECVMLAIGRKPRIDDEMMAVLGVEYSNKGIIIDEFCRTSNSDIYACGDVTGKLMLAHTAYCQAKIIADNANGKNTKINYEIIPRIIYCNPEVLSVGLSEEDCKAMELEYRAKSLPMTYSGKYFAENGKDGAKAKMIVDKDNQVIGFHMIGNGSSELSVAVEMMILNRMTCDKVAELVFPHPTYGEIVSDLAISFI